MFWNRIFKRNEWGCPVYQTQGGLYKQLAKHDEVKDGFEHVHKKFDLILDHLNLEYVPETEKKEPAKLVEKKSFSLGVDWGVVGDGCSITSTWKPTFTLEAKKKKRGRPKKK